MKVELKNNYSELEVNQPPSVLLVTSLLCLASVCWAALLLTIEYIVGIEMSGTGFLSTLIPAMSVGYYFGYKTGDIMPSKTRWCAVLLWTLASLVVFSIILMSLDISPFDLLTELGEISIFIAVVMLITIGIAYLILKSGEKMAIKVLLKAQKSA
ncbi:TPA: ABZJ_00895 family protein [Vibrio diabolicus]